MNFGDLDLILTSHDAQNAFSMHSSSIIHFLKICTWWPFVTMMPKMHFLFIGAQNTLSEIFYLMTFQNHWNYFWVVPLYCFQNSWNFEVSHDFYLQVVLSDCSCTCSYTDKHVYTTSTLQVHMPVMLINVLMLSFWYVMWTKCLIYTKF